MAAFNARFLLLAVLLPALAPVLPPRSAPAAARAAAGQTIILDAQSFDGANNNLVFRKIRISQGKMSISADLGQAQGQANGRSKGAKPGGLDFDNSLWVFRGNVRITLDRGQLTADDAEINFSNQQLSKAVANGKPATFEEHSANAGKLVHGRAETIAYDAHKGIVQLSKNAFLTRGDSEEVRSEFLKYDMSAQTIGAGGDGTPAAAADADKDAQRVHIVIPPPPSKP